MLDRIKSIKEALRNSSEIANQLEFMGTRKLSEYRTQAELITQFLIYNLQDKSLAKALDKVINSKEEQEVHNLIASFSYHMPLYGTKFSSVYYADKAKIALSAVIIEEYSRQYGSRKDVKVQVFNGRTVATELAYVPALDYNKLEKNILDGIHFQPNQVPTKHIKTKPGSPRLRLDKRLKQVAKAASGMKLRVISDVSGDDIVKELMKGDDYAYALKGKGSEHRLAMKARFEKYGELFSIIQAKGLLHPLYLSVNFDYRGRVYYDHTSVFLNPQSKVGKYLWEAYTPKRLGRKDYEVLCFAASSSVSRRAPEGSVEYFESNEEYVRKELLKEKSFLGLVYNKRLLKAIDDYRTGTKSRFLVLLDYTTGGLLHFSSGYTQEYKAMKLANILKGEELQDTHQTMANEIAKITGLTISRKDAKVINQSILAGVSLKSMTDKFNKYFKEELHSDKAITKSQMGVIGEGVYGHTFSIFHKYNEWGKGLVDNANSSLKWIARDGVKCMSSAYIKGQAVSVYVPMVDREKAKKVTVHRNMPLLIENNSHTPLLVGDKAQAKMSGFLANTTHSIDATPLREMIVTLAEDSSVGIFIHDNIGTFGINHIEFVRPIARENIEFNFKTKVFLDIQRQVSESRVGSRIPVIDYSVSDVTEFEVSDNFLQA